MTAWAPPPLHQPLSEAIQQMDMLLAEIGQPAEWLFYAREGGGVWHELDFEHARIAAANGVSVELRLRVDGSREKAALELDRQLAEERERRRNAPREIAAGIPHAGQYIAAGEI